MQSDFSQIINISSEEDTLDRSLGSLSALTHCDVYQKYLAIAWSIPVFHESSFLNPMRHLYDTPVNSNLLYGPFYYSESTNFQRLRIQDT